METEITYEMIVGKMKNQISDLMYELTIKNAELEVKNNIILELQDKIKKTEGFDIKNEKK